LRSNATITFGVIPFPNPELRGHMEAMATRIGFPQAASHD
jgi:3-hydroxyacyl-[acyl-carrier-protein] dehydratase